MIFLRIFSYLTWCCMMKSIRMIELFVCLTGRPAYLLWLCWSIEHSPITQEVILSRASRFRGGERVASDIERLYFRRWFGVSPEVAERASYLCIILLQFRIEIRHPLWALFFLINTKKSIWMRHSPMWAIKHFGFVVGESFFDFHLYRRFVDFNLF